MELINVNKADASELVKLVHIGKKRAIKIIEGRPYKDLYELSKVSGLGKKRIDDIVSQGLIV